MLRPQEKDPLHGITLEMIVTYVFNTYGWEELARQIPVKCFMSNPTIKSSLTFLRKTEWARKRVEGLYTWTTRKGVDESLFAIQPERVLKDPKKL